VHARLLTHADGEVDDRALTLRASLRYHRRMATVRFDDHAAGVRVLTLDRPPANAIDETLLADLHAALDAARTDDGVRAVVLRGAGAFVSGGFDLATPRRDADAARRLATLYRDVHLALLAFPKPTVAFLHGHAVAGGLILVLACDYRLGALGDHRVGLNELAIGASFPRVALEIVRLRLPDARASELLLGASLYPASQALRLGVVDELLPLESAEATILRRAGRLGAFPRDAYAHTKAALVADAVARTKAETEAEAAATAAIWTSAESRAARAAQRQKLGIG
jgi:enoyl-CoA hydratase